MNFRQLKLCIVIVFFSHKVVAQNSQYQFSQLDINNGLSHNHVQCIYKDKRGFMWFGTMSGLNRYDGYSFKVFKHETNNAASLNDDCIVSICEGPGNKLWIETRRWFNIYDPVTGVFDHNISAAFKALNISSQTLSSIKKDSKGNYWFICAGNGVFCYNMLTKSTQHFTVKTGLHNNNITGFTDDGRGHIWLVYNDGLVDEIDIRNGKFIYSYTLLSQANKADELHYEITSDNDGDLWMFSSGTARGIYYFSPAKNISRHFDKNTAGLKLNSNLIYNVKQDDKGIIWIATDHGGINLVNKKDFSVRYLLNREDDAKSIAQNSGIIYKDNLGIMWYGTLKEGISYYHESIIQFPLYRHYQSAPGSLPFDDINHFAEDDAGNLWIGTNGGGLIYFDRKKVTYKQYRYQPGNSNSLANDVIISLFIDHEKKLWIGTYSGGLDCFDGKRFVHYKHNAANPASISDDRVLSIYEDSSNRLWVGTFLGGLNLFDPAKKSFIHYKPFQPNSVNSQYISSIFEDRDKNIWFGSYYGIDVLQKSNGVFKHFLHANNNRNSLVMNNVITINQDSRGLMWIGTLEGLNIYDSKTKKFSLLQKENGLPDNLIVGVLEDDSHNMWVSTPKGLCNITVVPTKYGYTYQFKNFDETDGLQGREFNENAAFKTTQGELIFSGARGFNMFKPAMLSYRKSEPVIVLTDLYVYNKSVTPGEVVYGHTILSKSITETDQLNLNYNENAFSLEFADLNFFNSGKLKFQYKLEGLDKGWITTDSKSRRATYTNLDPGDYVFKVRGVNNGYLPSHELTLQVKIKPPFWKTGAAYLFYLAGFIGLLLYIRHRGIRKIETKFALERERQEARHLHEVNMVKIDFFTNISHEFRTPISLILAPVEKLLLEIDDKAIKNRLKLVHQNSKRLLNMINQLLDFSKIGVQKLQLELIEDDIIQTVNDAYVLFKDLADKKNIKLVFECDVAGLVVFFDKNKIEAVLFNLLSNALKFTPARGVVKLELKLPDNKGAEIKLVEIRVKDTGIGIAAEKHQKVFERFYQDDVPSSMINQGSGIGLAIAKEFVNLMGGLISVESEKGKGSCFIVRLPLKVSHKIVDAMAYEQLVTAEKEEPATGPRDKKNKGVTILVVEDNADFRAYLKDDLGHNYNIAEANNGKEGWQKALALHPNLIISDINMPEVDGLDFCKKIRGDKRTEHIPVILITALTGEKQQLNGLLNGANDYITKPFNFEVLHFKIKNLLKHQQSVKETYQKQVETKPADADIETPDEKFIKKTLAIVERNISNSSFSVEMLSSEANMSRVTLYKKMFELTGKTPIEFIKSTRLKRAVQLLQMDQFTIAEIAYQVGYNDPKYFTKAFKSEFNVLPSNYLTEVGKN